MTAALKYISIQTSPVYLVGDLLGETEEFVEKIRKMNLRDCSLFFVGNMNFVDDELANDAFSYLDEELFQRNIFSYVIRGNLDNPHLWNDSDFWRGFRSFRAVGSSTRLNINGNIGIVIDGASTLIQDKDTKIWPEFDKPSYPFDFEDFGESLKNVDFVIGHGGPVLSDFFRLQKGYEIYMKDGFLNPKLGEEQRIYRQILRRYRPKRWYCGHYQISKHTKFVWDNWSDDGTIDLKIINKGEILRIA